MMRYLVGLGWCIIWLFLVAGCASDEERMQDHFERGKAYLDNQEYRAAIIELKNAIQINPEFIEAHLELGTTHIQLKEFNAAYWQYTTVLRLDPSNEIALLKLAVFDLNSQRYEQSRNRADMLLRQHSDHMEALYVLARLEQVEHRPENAVALYQKILQLDSQPAPAFLGLVNVHVEQGNMTQAEGFMKKFLDGIPKVGNNATVPDDGPLTLKPRFAQALNRLVDAYLARNDAASAIGVCDRLLAHPGNNSTQTALYHAMGNIHLAQNRVDLAESNFQMAITKDPGHQSSYRALADTYIANKAPEKATRLYRKAVASNPEHIEFRYYLAVLYDNQSQHDLAEQHYRKALDIRRDYTPAANNLAYLLAKTGNQLDEALDIAQRIAAKEPANPAVQHTLGFVYLKKEQYDRAIQAFEASLDGSSEHAIVYFHLGDAHYLTGQKEAAVAALEKALAIDPYAAEAAMARQRLESMGVVRRQ